MFLAVTTEKIPSDTMMPALFPLSDSPHQYSYGTSFEFASTAASILVSRTLTGSLEISADERYFVNDRQGKEANIDPHFIRVKQRAIEPAELAAELEKITEPANRPYP